MKYWHPHLPFGQHISVCTLVEIYKINSKLNISELNIVYKTTKRDNKINRKPVYKNSSL